MTADVTIEPSKETWLSGALAWLRRRLRSLTAKMRCEVSGLLHARLNFLACELFSARGIAQLHRLERILAPRPRTEAWLASAPG
jgi:hypothetical protein